MKNIIQKTKFLGLALMISMSGVAMAEPVSFEQKQIIMESLKAKTELNDASIKFLEDLSAIKEGLNKYKFEYALYQYGRNLTLISAYENVGKGKWNEKHNYISKEVGSKWAYATLLTSDFDVEDVATGMIVIKTSQTMYPLLSKEEIANILKDKCLNGMSVIKGSGISMITKDTLDCIISKDSLIIK